LIKKIVFGIEIAGLFSGNDSKQNIADKSGPQAIAE